MIIDKSSSELIDLKSRLYQIVAENKISSLSMMSDMAGSDEELIRQTLEELVNEGALEGSFTSDGQRFFMSDVSVSTAPVAPTQDSGFKIEQAETKTSKIILVSGFVMMVVGFFLRGLTTINAMMEHIGSAVFMVGMIILIGGWLMLTKANPPSNIK